MNHFIEYYYDFYNIKTIQEKNSYIFKYKEKIYSFSLLERNPQEIYEIERIVPRYAYIDTIVRNKYDELITSINDKLYILTHKKNALYNNAGYLFKTKFIINSNGILDKSNWVELWSKKIDNIEYQLKHIINKFPIVCRCVNYYIGLAENGISYIRKINNTDDNKVISHIRISKENISDPQNIIIDKEARDICEYLKYSFFARKDEYMKLARNVFQENSFNTSTMMYIYGRMFFLTCFFDQYDAIIKNSENDDMIMNIICRVDEYENYIRYIYLLISETKKIPKIEWV